MFSRFYWLLFCFVQQVKHTLVTQCARAYFESACDSRYRHKKKKN